MSNCLQCGCTAEHKIPEGDHNPRLVCTECDYIHYENPKLICGALVIDNTEDETANNQPKVLLCRRAIEPRHGFWTLPAGFMEIGETLVEGASRETLEEADAVMVHPKLYCIYDIPAIGQVYMLYLATLQDGKFGVGPESLECALFDEADIPWDHLAFEAVRRTLTHYFNDRKALKEGDKKSLTMSKTISETTSKTTSKTKPNNPHPFNQFPLHQETIEKDKRLS